MNARLDHAQRYSSVDEQQCICMNVLHGKSYSCTPSWVFLLEMAYASSMCHNFSSLACTRDGRGTIILPKPTLHKLMVPILVEVPSHVMNNNKHMKMKMQRI